MRRIQRFYLFSVLALVMPFAAHAQDDFRPGYVVKNGQDTLKGFVIYHRKQNDKNLICKYKESANADATSYSPDELMAYGFNDGKLFRSMLLPKDSLPEGKVFVKVLADGPVSLYGYGNYFFVVKDGIMTVLPVPYEMEASAQSRPGQVQRSNSKDRRFAGLLSYLLKDCHINTSKAGYYESDLTSLADDFNKCKGQTKKRTIKAGAFIRLNAEIFTGYSVSFLKTHDYLTFGAELSYKKSFTVPVGIGLDISFPQISDKIFFSGEFWSMKSFYQGQSLASRNGDLVHQDGTFKLDYFKIPFGLRYNILRGKGVPYVKAGYTIFLLQKSSSHTILERQTSDGTINGDEYNNNLGTFVNPDGFWLSLGYEREVYKKFRLFIEERTEINSGFIAITNFTSSAYGLVDGTSVNYNILIGVRF